MTKNMSSSTHRKRWFPIESNPAVMNAFVQQMGFPTSVYRFCDVLSTDDWAFEMVPTPVLGVIMLYPITPRAEAFNADEKARILRDGQYVSDQVYYMRQTVGNACGTIGLLHAIGNMRAHVSLDPASYLGKLFAQTQSMTPEEIAEYIARDNELEATHSSAAGAGQSQQLESVDDDIITHFVCFSHVDGHLYELDGSKSFPINHGPTTQETLLADACRVVRAFMARDETELRFTVVALAKTPDEMGE